MCCIVTDCGINESIVMRLGCVASAQELAVAQGSMRNVFEGQTTMNPLLYKNV